MERPSKLFVAFTGQEIFREAGRLPYPLIHAFVSAGYEVLVFDDLKRRLCEAYKCEEADLPQPAHLVLTMKGITFTSTIPEDAEEFAYLFDHPLEAAKQRSWKQRLRVRYDLFSTYHIEAPIIVPYAMYPAHSENTTDEDLAELRALPRQMRVFFAGDSKGYVRNRVRYPGPKLPRQSVLKVVRASIPEHLLEVSGIDDIRRNTDAGYVARFVLIDSASGIPPAQWLRTLASADFFLCPPGIVMPMCHNAIEAMAVGAIPVIGYSEWFRPHLEHMKNCIAFDDEDSLVGAMQTAISLPAAQIEDMRRNVIAYYDEYLQPTRLVEAIERRSDHGLTLLLHTELNTAQNATKLTRNSVLVQGPRADSWLRRLAPLASWRW
jgi:hypothetical protein